jgi:hypothetical protein
MQDHEGNSAFIGEITILPPDNFAEEAQAE